MKDINITMHVNKYQSRPSHKVLQTVSVVKTQNKPSMVTCQHVWNCRYLITCVKPFLKH